jgi:hypothetical protein
MSENPKPAAVLAARIPSPSRPCLEITPDTDQYEQLVGDLKLLRRLGAASNTDAIVEAVHQHAARKRGRPKRSGSPVEKRRGSK